MSSDPERDRLILADITRRAYLARLEGLWAQLADAGRLILEAQRRAETAERALELAVRAGTYSELGHDAVESVIERYLEVAALELYADTADEVPDA